MLFIVLFGTQVSKGQDNSDIDMFENIKQSLSETPKFYISFDNKNSFISSRNAWFFGGKIGLEHQEIFRYGLGFYGLFNKSYSTYINGIKESEENMSFNYLSFFAEYIFKNNERYEFSIPVSLGIGYSWLADFETVKNGHIQLLYETQLNGMYYPLSFFGIGAGVGYRIMLINNPYIDEKFTAPIYSFKVKLILGKLFIK